MDTPVGMPPLLQASHSTVVYLPLVIGPNGLMPLGSAQDSPLLHELATNIILQKNTSILPPTSNNLPFNLPSSANTTHRRPKSHLLTNSITTPSSDPVVSKIVSEYQDDDNAGSEANNSIDDTDTVSSITLTPLNAPRPKQGHPRHPCAWPESLLMLDVKSINQFIKSKGLSPEHAANLKECRRRMLNRHYAAISHSRRRAKARSQPVDGPLSTQAP